MIPREEKVRSMVWTKTSEQPTSREARTTARVERTARPRIKGDRPFKS